MLGVEMLLNTDSIEGANEQRFKQSNVYIVLEVRRHYANWKKLAKLKVQSVACYLELI